MRNRKQKTIILEPDQNIKHYWHDIWQYKELFGFLAWRDILVRYKQTAIGIAWSIIRPLLTMIVFTVIFNKVANLSSGDTPYSIMVFAALLPWQLFANSLTESSQSIISNEKLISKVYFPRIIIPASSVIVSLMDFLISCAILGLLMFWYQFVPGWKIVTIPFFLSIAMFISFGVGLWISALNVKYRDFRYVVPFIVQLGLYISPVGFNSAVVPERWRLIYSMNPMVGVIDGFRWAILGGNEKLYWPGFIISIILTATIYYYGLLFFRKAEKTFADFI